MLIRQFFDSKLFGSSLISRRDWRGPLLAPPPPLPCRRQKRDPAPIPAVNVQVYFKRRRKESKKKKRRRTEWKWLCHFFSKKTCFSIKISVFLIISVFFFVVFRMNAACVFFTLILFFCLFVYTPLPHRLTPPSPPHPPTPTPPKNSSWRDPNEVTCIKKKDKNKNWRTSVGGSGGEPVMIRWAGKRHQKKIKWRDGGGGGGRRRTLTLYRLKVFVFVFFLFGTPRRHARQAMS